MSDLQAEFAQLMQRVRAGDPRAAQEVFDRYSEPIRRVVRRYLHQRLRTQYDSIDILQTVWASFFQVPPEQYTFATPEDLIGFLSQMAHNKAVDVFRRRLQTDKNNLNRQVSFDEPAADLDRTLPVRQPTPSQLAIAEEHWERIIKGQPPRVRQVLEMLRMGHTQREAADRFGLHPKTIKRLLEKLLPRVDLP
ncbi:MAG TPA: sigma-70 family RNA polymerase sigma factor [Gemmataceae bacterium]|jgi:RNA polymerase sigma-70 factor (ECF subfamily)|nr:sigma-70 family RNA polymerase sigma factor [Gemmataceae bacterium]